MTFNLHCLQHLPNQVQKYGPLHKCDCFPFEGWFKNTKLLHNRTSNISGQIAKNLKVKLKIHFELETENIRKPELKAFVQKNSQSKYVQRQFIHKPQFSQILFFHRGERQKIQEKFGLCSSTQVQYGYTATINNISNFIRHYLPFVAKYLICHILY